MLILPFFAWFGKLSGLQLISVTAGISPGCGHTRGQPLVTELGEAHAAHFVTGFPRLLTQQSLLPMIRLRDYRDPKRWQRFGGNRV